MTNNFWIKEPKHWAGIGYKSRYFDDVINDDHQIGWLEIHAENYMMDGGPIKAQLAELAELYPITCHGVGLSIGSMQPLNDQHLQRLKVLNDWLKPAIFSEHLAWSTHSTKYFNDLLPLPYTQQVLGVVVDHIKQVQDTLGRQMLLENPSTYVAFDDHEMSETDFIQQIVARSECGLLLDVNNVYVTATNQQLDATSYIDQLPLDSVGELHLSGHSVDADSSGAPLLIDSHDAPVDAAVWALYDHTISKLGATPTLIEWDSNFPEWSILRDQAHRANAAITAISQENNRVAG